MAEISPTTLIFSRAGLGSVLLCAILALRRQPVLPPRDARGPLALMGFVGVAFHQLAGLVVGFAGAWSRW